MNKKILLTIGLLVISWLFLIEKPGGEPDERITDRIIAFTYLRWEANHLIATNGWFDYPKKQRKRIVDSLYETKFEYLN